MATEKSKTSKAVCIARSLAVAVLVAALSPQVAAQDAAATHAHPDEAQAGEVVYVTVYPDLLSGEKGSKQPLSSTLRNRSS